MAEPLVMQFVVVDEATPKVNAFKQQLLKLVGTLNSADSGMTKINKNSSKTSSMFTKMNNIIKGVTKSLFSMTGAITGVAGAYGLVRLGKSFINAAATAERYKTMLEISTRSTEKAVEVFKYMSEYAARVPHTYEDIMGAATQLSRVMGGSVKKVKEWMPFIGDLAAAIGLGIQETTTQVTRMLSAGAASADRFRELGVLAMLGFKAGVSYSVEDTRKIMLNAWNKTDSQFKGATDKLAKTWDGMMSMMADKWFQLRQNLMDAGLFDWVKEKLDGILKTQDEIIKLLDNNKPLDKQLSTWEKILKIVDKLPKSLKVVGSGLALMITGFGAILLNNIYKATKAIGSLFKILSGWLITIIKGTFIDINKYAVKFMMFLQKIFGTRISGEVIIFMNDAVNKIKSIITTLGTWMKTVFTSIFSSLKTMFLGIFKITPGIISTTGAAAVAFFGTLLGFPKLVEDDTAAIDDFVERFKSEPILKEMAGTWKDIYIEKYGIPIEPEIDEPKTKEIINKFETMWENAAVSTTEKVKNIWENTISDITGMFISAFSDTLMDEPTKTFEEFSENILKSISSNIANIVIEPKIKEISSGLIKKYFPEGFEKETSITNIINTFAKTAPKIKEEIQKELDKLSIKLKVISPPPDWKYIPWSTERLGEKYNPIAGSSISKSLDDLIRWHEEFIKAEKELKEYRLKIAKELAEGISQAWKDSFTDLIMGNKTALQTFVKDAKNIFAKKFTEDMFKGMDEGLTKALAKPIKIGDKSTTLGDAMGGGILGYQMGSVIGGTETSQMLGAAGGAIGSLWGPVGSAVGGALGSMVGTMISETEKAWKDSVPPDINILFKVIDGKLEEIGDWGDKASAEVKDRVREIVNTQIDTMQAIMGILGDEFRNISIGFQDYAERIGSNAESGLQKSFIVLSSLPETLGLLSDEAVQSIKDQVYKGVFTAGYKGIAGVEGAVRVATGKGLELTTVGEEIIDKIMSGSEEGAKLWTTVIDEWRAGHSEKGWNITMGELDVAWGNIYDELQKLAETMNEYFASSISGAFADYMNSGDFSVFTGSLRQNIYEGAKAGLISAFQEKLYLKLLEPLYGQMKDVFDQIQSIGNMTTDEARSKIAELTGNFKTVMNELIEDVGVLEPFMKEFYDAIGNMSDSMNMVSDTMMNTQQELVDSMLSNRQLIDDWLREMRGGEQSPVVSMEWMQNQYQALLEAAQTFGTTEDIQRLLDFAQGTYLPFMEAASFRGPTDIANEMTGNYKDIFESVMSDVEKLGPTDDDIRKELMTLTDILTELGNQTELLTEYKEILDTYGGPIIIPTMSAEDAWENFKDNFSNNNVIDRISDKLGFSTGGLTSGLSIAGESGPEWIVPVYEPQRSTFLRDVGVDSAAIGKEIARHIMASQSTGGGEIHVHVEIDGNEIGRAFVEQAQRNPDIRTTVKDILR